MYLQEIIAKNIAKRREELGMKKRELANKLMIQEQTVIGWEKCRHMPDTNSLCNLADALECSVDYLLGRGGNG